ncbi:MAG: PDZ domain-containing protein [Lentimicrobium sp.]|nr:PDZ domain-containing protein [Lentimicrobium sp.]
MCFFSNTLFAQYGYFSLPEGRKKVFMRFSNFDNLVVVDVTLNDTIPVRLLLDTGVEGIIITDMSIVSLFENKCIRNFKLTAPGTNDELEACISSPVKINMGKLNPVFTNLILLNQDYFSLDEYIGSKVHGLISMSKFRNLAVTTDYDQNKLKFQSPERYHPPFRSEIIPISIFNGKPHMTARVELDNGDISDYWLMIDSGANHPLLLEMDSLSDYKPKKSIDAIIGRGLGGNLQGSFARVGWLMLGNFRLDDVITSFAENYTSEIISLKLNRDGTLGSGALGRFKVTFDYLNNRMILEKGSKFRAPFEYNMSGMSFRSFGFGFNLFEVSEVIPASPAEDAGLQVGDVILSLDGKSTFLLSLGELNRILSEKEGNIVTMVVLRDGKELDFRLKLRKII